MVKNKLRLLHRRRWRGCSTALCPLSPLASCGPNAKRPRKRVRLQEKEARPPYPPPLWGRRTRQSPAYAASAAAGSSPPCPVAKAAHCAIRGRRRSK